MKIKTKLTLNFSILVAGIMIIFSLCVFFFYLAHRQEDFRIRLRNKAINTATLLTRVKEIDNVLMRIIDDNTVTNMSDVIVIVLDKDKHLLYSNQDSQSVTELLPEFEKLNWEKKDRRWGEGRLYLGFEHKYNGQIYYVLASGIDQYGKTEMKKLVIILSGVLISSLLLIVIAGYYNAKQSLKPIKDVIRQMREIKASNLSKRVTIKNKDEISELASTFNSLLERLERAFETERMFVSNASHELRTPITSVIGQLEVELLKPRSEEEYKAALASVLEDVKSMKNIINGFLDLAETAVEPKHREFERLRADELLFSVKESMLKRRPDYAIQVEFEELPEDENDVSITGNSRLISALFTNLIDNACKFSSHHKVVVKIGFEQKTVVFRFINNGIGIPKEEIRNIFNPLYRGSNATGEPGNGIGLSIVKKIADIHGANIVLITEQNVGTTFVVSFPKQDAVIKELSVMG
jgi:signal transduction histidine kinase